MHIKTYNRTWDAVFNEDTSQKIGIYNDGKGKAESYEATYFNSRFDLYIRGYGETEEEAVKNCKNEISILISCFIN